MIDNQFKRLPEFIIEPTTDPSFYSLICPRCRNKRVRKIHVLLPDILTCGKCEGQGYYPGAFNPTFPLNSKVKLKIDFNLGRRMVKKGTKVKVVESGYFKPKKPNKKEEVCFVQDNKGEGWTMYARDLVLVNPNERWKQIL